MALSMPIVKPKLPDAATQYPNGSVPRSQLWQVEPDQTDLHELLFWMVAIMMRALHFAARVEAGYILATTGRNRTLFQQYEGFCGSQARYEPCTSAQYWAAKPFGRGKTWSAQARFDVQSQLRAQGHNVTVPNSTYWRKRKLPNGTYPATAAVPGTSNHGAACSDDMALRVNGKVIGLTYAVIQWLYANARRFGFAWELKSEPWHVTTIAGNILPEEVKRYQNVMAAPVLSKGDTGPYVMVLQAQLNGHGHTLTVDGQFGQKTKDAVVWQEGKWRQPQDGLVDADFWWMVGKGP